MLCPYNLAKQKTVTQTTSEQGSYMDVPDTQTIEATTYQMQDCPQEECGAWTDGHCSYRGAIE